MKKKFEEFLRLNGLTSVQAYNLACIPYNTAKNIVSGQDKGLSSKYRLVLLTGTEYVPISQEELFEYEEQKHKNPIWTQAEDVAKWLIARWKETAILPEGLEAINESSDKAQNLPSYLLHMGQKIGSAKGNGLRQVQQILQKGGNILVPADIARIEESARKFIADLDYLLASNAQDIGQAKRRLVEPFGDIITRLTILSNPNPHEALQRQLGFQNIFNPNS